jgi:MFS family permease
VIEGITTSLNSTAVYALAPIEFPKNKEKVIGYIEMAAGLGLTLGPFISGIVYNYLHYAGTFIFFSIILSMSAIFLQVMLPNRLNKSTTVEINDESNET